LVEHLTF